MQKLILIFFALLFAVPTFAQRERSMLKIRDMEGRKITVEINGRRYERVGRMLTFKDLPPRNHNIRVYVVNRRNNGVRNARLIYAGRLRTRPGKIYYVTVDDYEKLDIITDCCLGDNGPWNEPNSWYRSRYYDQQNWEGDIQFNPQRDTYYNYGKNNRDNRRNNGNGNTRRNNRNNDDWNHFQDAMSSARFNDLLKQMDDAGFESNRMNVVKQALDNNHISTDQLVSVLKALSFESSRLNIAKMAYDKVVDKQNTYKISNGFSFSSSRDEYDRFLENRRK